VQHLRSGDPGQPLPIIECRTCGAGAPADEHFCGQCSRILSLGRQGDYFSFFGLSRSLQVDLPDLEKRFRELSRKLHPDFFYNAPPAERLASLERSSYLNDAYRALRDPIARVEHLLAIEGLASPQAHPSMNSGQAAAKVPPVLLEEVFTLNEELDEIREAREGGAGVESLRPRLDAARRPIEQKRDEHERRLQELMARWDAEPSRPTLEALRDLLLERNYINNLLATIDRESGAGSPEPGAHHG
jgi:molecular chaperone HscB